jgi:PAS domain S-box-containing protein
MRGEENPAADKTEFLRNLMENIPDSIYFKDKNNRFIMVNKAKAEHVGSTPEDIIGKTDFDFYPKEIAEKMAEDDKRVMETGEPIVGRAERIVRRSGEVRWVSVTKVPLRDEKGAIMGTMGISRDITELKRAEDKLRESEKRYRDLIENLPVGILATDENGIVVYENPVMGKIMGMPEGGISDAIGTKLAEMPNVIAAGVADKVKEVLKGNPVSGSVFPFVSIYGRRCFLLVDGLPIKDTEGRITGGLFVIQDITERKRAEEERVRAEVAAGAAAKITEAVRMTAEKYREKIKELEEQIARLKRPRE